MANINELFKAFVEDKCTPEMLTELLSYFNTDNLDELESLVESELNASNKNDNTQDLSSMIVRNHIAIQHKIQSQHSLSKTNYSIYRWLGATAAIFVVCFGIYFYVESNKVNIDSEIKVVDNDDLEPASNKAFLDLANGERIQLKNDQSGVVFHEGRASYANGENLMKLDNVSNLVLYTPKGGQYKIILSDGSKVWLNADSKLEYPSKFTANVRTVKLTGEAYFEVAKDSQKPFVVKSSSQELKVLGTSFNVEAYSAEKNITTLVEGSVNVSNDDNSQGFTLQSNKQAIVSNDKILINNVDVNIYTAWKDGYFKFRASSIEDVLLQLERWYDLEIDYDKIQEDIKVHAVIKRDKKLRSVLYALEEVTSLKFKLSGRRLEVIE